MSDIAPVLNVPQAKFLALKGKFCLFVGGFSSGKTWTLGAKACKHYWEHPRVNRGYFAPTYAQIRDIYYPTIEEVAHQWGLRVDIKEVNKEVHFYHGRVYRGTTICRSMEKPGSIVGFKIAEADVDELDTMPLLKAEQAWRKIIARLRLKYSRPNGVSVATTPEGFRFAHKQWVQEPGTRAELAELYQMVQASTYDNETNLPDDYIDSLLQSYPPNLIAAYLDGQFVNLATGNVYRMFDRVKNHCDDYLVEGEDIHVGMDFNVGKMAAVVHVERKDIDGTVPPRAVDEITKVFDTPAMIVELKTRYWRYDNDRGDYVKTREIYIYPDASGGSRKSSNASESDIKLLKQAGFSVRAPEANPPVKDRTTSMNAMFLNAKGERRYTVNTLRCPVYTMCLEQQAIDANGEPDKSAGLDHAPDAAGYYIHKRFPVKRNAARIIKPSF